MSYTFKRIDPGTYNDLIYISKSAFNINPGIEYYIRKNATSEFGEPHLGFLAYDEKGEPSAFYGVYAHPVIIDGVSYVAAQSGDTMTHKNHGGKGLFTTLAKMTYDLAKEKGIDFIFGFPNANSFPGFVKKLNWICPVNLKEFRMKVLTLPLAKISKKISIINIFYKLYVNFILSFYSPGKPSFENSVLEPGFGGVDRKEKFINYKSFSGCRMISVNGIQLWIKLDGFFFIGDIEKSNDCDYKQLIGKVKKLCFILGADTIVFQTNPETFLDKKFTGFIKSKESNPTGYLNLSGKTDPAKFKYVYADIDTF